MKRLDSEEDAGFSLLTAGDNRKHEPVSDEDMDYVVPNLLLDVREGFLASFRPIFRQFGITDQQFRVLSVLHSFGDQEISKLIRRCRIIAPSMTGILDRMVEIGWVTRKASNGQRWGVISLTTTGRKLITRLKPAADERVAVIEAALGAEHLTMLVELLVNARTALRNLNAPKTDASSTSRKRVPSSRTLRSKPRAQPKRSGQSPKSGRS